jgi:ribosomal protein L7/L12
LFSQSEAAEEEKEEQTEFTVKLTAFDAGGKVKLIKEIKNIIEGMNLVQVYKINFISSALAVQRIIKRIRHLVGKNLLLD